MLTPDLPERLHAMTSPFDERIGLYLSHLTLLYVEDDDDIRTLLGQFIERRVGRLLTAKNGREGLDAFREYRPDVVVTDILMPEMNGLAMIEAIRQIDPRIPVAITTAFNETDYLLKAIDLGIDKYLMKPLKMAKLETALLDIGHRLHIEADLQISQAVFETSPNGILVADALMNVVAVNPAFCAMTGFPREEVVGSPVLRIDCEALDEPAGASVWDLLRQKQAWSGKGKCKRRTGERFISSIMAQAIRNRQQEVVRYLYIGIVTDITDRVRADEELRLAAQVFESSGEAIVIADADNRIQTVNRAFTEITGYTQDEIVGKNPSVLKSGRHDRNFYAELWKRLHETGHWQGEIWNRRKNGEAYTEWLTITRVQDKDGSTVAYIGISSDITEQKLNQERIQYLANYDHLTRLPNRALLRDRLEHALASAYRDKTHVAVLFVDIDHFKLVNDSLGHTSGDRLLQEVAGRLKACIREEDTIARPGGDEFVIVLADIAQISSIGRIATDILRSLTDKFLVENQFLTITTSIGICVSPDDGSDPDALLRNAESAMYFAKESGRNNIQFYATDMNRKMKDSLALIQELRSALENDEFELHYQPQVNSETGRLDGTEALIRWAHPVRGLISPAQFIGFAELAGLIEPIGHWVLKEACRQLREWRSRTDLTVPVAVNLSAHQFKNQNLVKAVRDILADNDLEAHYLELEVTESTLMQDAESVIATFRQLKEMGVRIAIDDFGTGYSSLNYLKRFPIDRLKIDRSFVREICQSPQDKAICGAIVGIAKNLRLSTVAEGVETSEQLAVLKSLECDVIQGYLYGRPQPAEEFFQNYLAMPSGRNGGTDG